MQNPTNETPPPSNAFLKTLAEIRHGQTIGELSDKLAKVVAAVRLTGKAGTLKLKLKVSPATRGDVNVVTLEDSVSVDLPEANKAQTIMFATDENLLQRNDPRQMELTQLKVVPGAAPQPTELKTAASN
jgi:hypothetical protein